MTKMSENMRFTDSAVIEGARRTSDGFLVADVRVARTGVQVYRGADLGLTDRDEIRVWRPEEEVFSKDAIRTYAHRPVTMNHPTQMVTSENWRDLAVGQTGDEVVRDGQFVRVPLVLMDARAVSTVEGGIRELSMGYDATIEFVDGETPEGEKYDAVQRNLRMNHLAVVAKARGGSELRIGDDRSVEMADGATMKTQTVMLDGLSVVTTEQGAQALEKLRSERDKFQSQIADAQEASKSALAEKDVELAKKDAEIDALKAKILDESALDQLVEERASLVSDAQRILPDIEVRGKSAAEIRRETVRRKIGDSAVEGKSDDYVTARFDMLLDAAPASQTVRSAFSRSTPPNTSPDDRAEEEHGKYVKSLQDAWKTQSEREQA